MLILVFIPDEPQRARIVDAIRQLGWTACGAGSPQDIPSGLRPDAVVGEPAPEVVDGMGHPAMVNGEGDLSTTLATLGQIRSSTGSTLKLGDRIVDLRSGTVAGPGPPTQLTTREHSLLTWLVGRAGSVVSRSELLVQVWGYRAEMTTRTVDITIKRLRDKIEDDPSTPQFLKTLRGEGYRLHLPTVSAQAASGCIGRDADLSRIRSQIGPGRTVTLLGSAGVGKTHLATIIAQTQERSLWCSLMAVSPGAVGPAVAAALELPGSRADAPTLARALRNRGLAILILDNIEHVAPEVGGLIDGLMQAYPALCVLTTGRVRSRALVETIIRLDPLQANAARALFLTKARERVPQYGADDDASVDRLVKILGCNPLALTLASARTRLLGPAALLQRLEASVAWLRQHRPDDPRTSLAHALEASWQLLDPPEQHALIALAVVPKDCTLEAAEFVVGDRAVETIDHLLDHSLVHFAGGRLSLHVGVREFALAKGGTQVSSYRDRHHRFFAQLAAEQNAAAYGRGGWSALKILQDERQNLLAALEWGGEGVGAVVDGMLHDWELRDVPEPELAALERALSRTAAPEARSKILQGLAWVRSHRGDLPAARALIDEALGLELSPENRLWCRFRAGQVCSLLEERVEAQAHFAACLASGNGALTARCHSELATMCLNRHDGEAAIDHQEQMLRIARSIGCHPLEQAARIGIAAATLSQGRYERTLAECRAVEASQTHDSGKGTVAIYTGIAGIVKYRTGASEDAIIALRRSEALFDRWGSVGPQASSWYHLSMAHQQLRQWHEALDCALESQQLAQEAGAVRKEVNALFAASTAWLALGEVREGADTIDEARRLSASVPDRLSRLAEQTAQVRLAQGRWSEVDEALSGCVDEAETRTLKAMAAILGGETSTAARLLLEAIEASATAEHRGRRRVWLAMAQTADPSEAHRTLDLAATDLRSGWAPLHQDLLEMVRARLDGRPLPEPTSVETRLLWSQKET
ncbi:MAG: winged helix-turn-helix domain-containing protein [Myxococcota bacterium]